MQSAAIRRLLGKSKTARSRRARRCLDSSTLGVLARANTPANVDIAQRGHDCIDGFRPFGARVDVEQLSAAYAGGRDLCVSVRRIRLR